MYNDFYDRLAKAPNSVAIAVTILAVIIAGLLIVAWVTMCIVSPWLAILVTVLICSTRIIYWYFTDK